MLVHIVRRNGIHPQGGLQTNISGRKELLTLYLSLHGQVCHICSTFLGVLHVVYMCNTGTYLKRVFLHI